MSLLFTVAFDQMKASLLNKSIHIFKIRSYWFQTFQWYCTLNLSKQNFSTWPESMQKCTSLLAYFLNVVQISLLLNLCKLWMWYFKSFPTLICFLSVYPFRNAITSYSSATVWSTTPSPPTGWLSALCCCLERSRCPDLWPSSEVRMLREIWVGSAELFPQSRVIELADEFYDKTNC